jgi:hypothetical protein
LALTSPTNGGHSVVIEIIIYTRNKLTSSLNGHPPHFDHSRIHGREWEIEMQSGPMGIMNRKIAPSSRSTALLLVTELKCNIKTVFVHGPCV